MTCSTPPPLDDDAISAVLDGTAAPEVLAHVAGCSGCSARLEQARALEYGLSTRLYRWDCPPAPQLGEYHLGLLPPARRQAIATHLARCVRCSDELEELRAFLAVDAAAAAPSATAAPIARRLKTLVAHLLPAAPNLQAAGIRGAGSAPLIAQCGEAIVALDLRPNAHGAFLLTGQIADERGDQERWNAALVEVRGEGGLLGTTFVDDLGGFVCGELPADVADLRITSAQGLQIVVQGLH